MREKARYVWCSSISAPDLCPHKASGAAAPFGVAALSVADSGTPSQLWPTSGGGVGSPFSAASWPTLSNFAARSFSNGPSASSEPLLDAASPGGPARFRIDLGWSGEPELASDGDLLRRMLFISETLSVLVLRKMPATNARNHALDADELRR